MKRILKILAFLFGLCMVVSIIGAIFNPTRPNPASVAPTDIAATAIVPTRTPEASAEPVAATIAPTAGPTDTPMPVTPPPKPEATVAPSP